MAAVSARKQLPADIDQITNEELRRLSRELNVNEITLWRRSGSDIIAEKSSDPAELNMSSTTWGYWHTAFNQLLDNREVTIPQGQKLKDFWSGPYNFASSNPDKIVKWGYYYDGTTNYMINPYISVEP